MLHVTVGKKEKNIIFKQFIPKNEEHAPLEFMNYNHNALLKSLNNYPL
jgi:hypothetical protein